MPSRNKRSRGLLAKNCGVNDKGRLAKPRPLRIIPATASPGVSRSCSSGTRRLSIMSIVNIRLTHLRNDESAYSRNFGDGVDAYHPDKPTLHRIGAYGRRPLVRWCGKGKGAG